MTKLISLIISAFLAGSAFTQDIPYKTGSWNGDELGNQRALIRVESAADAVWVHIPWRRRDAGPEKKSVILLDAKTRTRIKNIVTVDINREYGDLIFQPVC